MVIIRKATLEDKAEVFDLLRQLMASASEESAINQDSGVETFYSVVSGDQGDVLLAEEDGSVFGMVTLSYPVAIRCGGTYASIEEFVVKEKARGKGVGGRLLVAAIDLAQERGCHEMVVNRPSDAGLPVYLRHGWKDAGKNLLMQPVRHIDQSS
jgi:GNAT superfamily N-acetyltransferase